ncbi:MAG: energy transducer TonB [Mucilaginibacter sp.]
MKNLILIPALILIASATVKAQETEPKTPRASDVVVLKVDSNAIFTAVENAPEYKGGMQAFYKYLQQSIHYPANAVKNRVQGKVLITFIVEKDGSLSNVKVARGVADDIDAEAIRVIKASPNWNPGTQNGRPVRVVYTVPINFSLQGR